jgi:acetolactate synthase-1/2/3 large subunit
MKPSTAKTGSQIVVDILESEGVTDVFGLTGAALIPLFDEIFRRRGPVRLINTRHEQGAMHMAEGYAKSTGKVGVVVVTSGPGATNTVTGLADANLDSVPLVVITGQVPRAYIGTDAFQEADMVGITRSCTKHNFLVKDIGDLPRILRDAFFIARSGRPGPVLVDLPKDVSASSAEVPIPSASALPLSKFVPPHDLSEMDRVADLVRAAKRPLIYAGGGVVNAGAAAELQAFARRTNIPVTLTLMGLGAYPAHDRQFIDMLGMHGSYRANMAVTHCDLLLAIGARFDDRVTGKVSEFASRARKVHLDVDPTSIGKNVKTDVHVLGDLRKMLRELASRCSRRAYADWWAELDGWNGKHPLGYRQEPGGKVLPQFVVDEVYRLTKGGAYITTEVGQHQMWAAQFYRFDKPRRWITSGGLGTMGFGFPAAVGVQFAHPGAQVVCLAGDGSFQMNQQELATVAEHRLPVKTVILNNQVLGMVKQWQDLFFGKRYANTLIPVQPDFVKLAEAYGIAGYRADTVEETKRVLKKALTSREACVVDIHVDPDEHVYPMVPAGGANKDMILSRAQEKGL